MGTNWMWILAAFVVILLFAVFAFSDSGPRASLPLAAMQARPPNASVSAPTTGPGSSTALVPGSLGSAPRLSGSQCRNTCRGQCGGGRPLIRLTRNQKSRGACHDTCRASICNYLSSDEYGYDND